MNYKIIVSPIASKNIQDAVEYYIKEATRKVASDFLKITKKHIKPYKQTLFTSFTIPIIVFCLLINFLMSLFLLLMNPIKLFS
ncbi:MAG: type II toxin-antitoxin system RelE/ParE family toxin [Flavobacteriaceae bacterium]